MQIISIAVIFNTNILPFEHRSAVYISNEVGAATLYFNTYLHRAGHTAKSEDLHGDKMYYELRRQYHCAAYNMLMAVISCTQNKLQFYMGFLFKEDPIKARKGPLLVVARPLLAITAWLDSYASSGVGSLVGTSLEL